MSSTSRPLIAEAPRAFLPTADRGALWLSGQYDDAARMLRAAVLAGRGLLALVGESGIGKTVLTYALADRLRDDPVVVGRLRYPIVEGVDVFGAIAEAFGLSAPLGDRPAVLDGFGRFVDDVAASGRRVLLIVDGAETLSPELLLELGRLPHRDGADGAAFVSVLMVGPRAVLEALRAGGVEPATLCDLRPLTREQTADYISHRLRRAGHRRQLFTPSALRKTWVVSEGIPRAVNARCIEALGALPRLHRRRVTAAMIDPSRRSRGDGSPRESRPATSAPVAAVKTRSLRRWAWLAAALVIGFGVGAIGSATQIGRFVFPSPGPAAREPVESGWLGGGATVGRAEAVSIAGGREPAAHVDTDSRTDDDTAAVRTESPAAVANPPAPVVAPAPQVAPPVAKTPPRPDVTATRPRSRPEAPPARVSSGATDESDHGGLVDWVLGQRRTGTATLVPNER